MSGPGDVGVINTFRDSGELLYHNLGHIAVNLFLLLAIIQVSVYCIKALVAGEGGHKFFFGLAQVIFTISFFYFFLFHSAEWIAAIFSGMIDFAKTGLGSAAGAVDPSPSGMINLGIHLSGALFAAAFSGGILSGIVPALVACFMAFFIMILIGLMAMEVTIVYCKYFLAAAMSGLFVAVAPLDFTRPMTMNYVKAMIGLSLQMFTIVMIVGVFAIISVHWSDVISSWSHDISNMADIWAIPVEMIIFYGLMKVLPPWVAQISGIGGFGNHTDTAIATAAMGAGLATKATQGVVTGKGVGGVGLTNVAPMVGRGLVTGGKDVGIGVGKTAVGAAKVVGGVVAGGASALAGNMDSAKSYGGMAGRGLVGAGKGMTQGVKGAAGAAGGHAAKNASIEALSSLKNKLSSHPTKHDRNFGQRMNDRNRAEHGTPLKNLAESLKSKMNKPTEQGE